MRSKQILILFAVVFAAFQANGWLFKSSGSRSRPHDIRTQSGLTNLYNQRVKKIERVERPMGVPWNLAKHQGVRVTTEDGGKWLVHKGPGYGGRGGNTVITNAKHMSKKWSTVRSSNPFGKVKVGDVVKRGGKGYNLGFDNCYHGATRMENPKGRKRRNAKGC